MKRLGWIAIVAGAVLGLAACGGDPAPEEATRPAAARPGAAAAQETATTPEPAATAEASVTAQPAVEDLPKLVPVDLAREAKAGKPGAPIELKYELTASPEVGQPFVIDFALEPQTASPVMRVMVVASEGLALRQSSARPLQRNVEADSEYWHQIVVEPSDNGAFSVNVIAILGDGPDSMARTFSIPVIVGSPSPSSQARKPAPQVDATGQAIQPVPGQESR